MCKAIAVAVECLAKKVGENNLEFKDCSKQTVLSILLFSTIVAEEGSCSKIEQR